MCIRVYVQRARRSYGFIVLVWDGYTFQILSNHQRGFVSPGHSISHFTSTFNFNSYFIPYNISIHFSSEEIHNVDAERLIPDVLRPLLSFKAWLFKCLYRKRIKMYHTILVGQFTGSNLLGQEEANKKKTTVKGRGVILYKESATWIIKRKEKAHT